MTPAATMCRDFKNCALQCYALLRFAMPRSAGLGSATRGMCIGTQDGMSVKMSRY